LIEQRFSAGGSIKFAPEDLERTAVWARAAPDRPNLAPKEAELGAALRERAGGADALRSLLRRADLWDEQWARELHLAVSPDWTGGRVGGGGGGRGGRGLGEEEEGDEDDEEEEEEEASEAEDDDGGADDADIPVATDAPSSGGGGDDDDDADDDG
jgi:hypothetical protein